MDKSNVSYYYKTGFWKIGMVRMAVKKGIITKKQFKEITGEEY